MSPNHSFILGADDQGCPVRQLLRLSNRHGLVAGATGTGKTVTLQHLAECFSDAGVAVFASDVKGDLSGLGAAANPPTGKLAECLASWEWFDYQPKTYPVTFWDVRGETGHHLRTTISEMGPLLLGNLLKLTDAQQAALQAAFQVADREGLLLLDLKDLKSLLVYLSDNPDALGEDRALFNKSSAQALLRRLAGLEQQDSEALFGEPALALSDLLQPTPDGRGPIHLLDASRLLLESPKVYATLLLWLLAELAEQLPERGDADKPVLALFFDEAHLMFDGTSKLLEQRLEQTVRLIRSKGVGVYFVTQSPGDLPDDVLTQLGLRIQHGLRAFTPKERQALKAVAQGFRPNPAIDTERALTELGIGQALVSTLEEKGMPAPVERVHIAFPQSRIGPLTEAERARLISQSPLRGHYENAIDRESAYEILQQRAEQKTAEPEATARPARRGQAQAPLVDGLLKQVLSTATRQAVNLLSRQLVRGLLGALVGGRGRRR